MARILWVMTIASPNGESKKYNNRKANAINTEIEVVSIFLIIKQFKYYIILFSYNEQYHFFQYHTYRWAI